MAKQKLEYLRNVFAKPGAGEDLSVIAKKAKEQGVISRNGRPRTINPEKKKMEEAARPKRKYHRDKVPAVTTHEMTGEMPWYSTEKTAQMFGVTVVTIRKWMNENKLKSRRINRSRYVSDNAVREYLGVALLYPQYEKRS